MNTRRIGRRGFLLAVGSLVVGSPRLFARSPGCVIIPGSVRVKTSLYLVAVTGATTAGQFDYISDRSSSYRSNLFIAKASQRRLAPAEFERLAVQLQPYVDEALRQSPSDVGP